MSQDALFRALSNEGGVPGVEGALSKLDPDDTRVGARLWAAVRTDSAAVAPHTAAWRFLAQAPPGAFDSNDLNAFFRALSRVKVDRIDPEEGRIPWDVTFDTMLAKRLADRDVATLDHDVDLPLRAALRVAMVRHGIVEASHWGDSTARAWLQTLLPVWDRYPGYADEFVRVWHTESHGQLAIEVAADPHTELRTTDFLTTFAPYADAEERLRIVLNIAAPEAMERALAVLEEDHRDVLAVIFGSERRWFERIFDDFGSLLFGAHGIVGGPGLVGLVIAFAAYRLAEVRFALFCLIIAATFVLWRLALALSVRPRLPWAACVPLASSPVSSGLLAGWITYRRSLAKKKCDRQLLDHFFDGLTLEFPELGRPSRLRTVIEVNLQQLEEERRTEKVLQIFRADDAVERWAILEFCPTHAVALAAIDATLRFDMSDEVASKGIAAAPPVAQEALSKLAAHHQELFLSALDDGDGAEEILVFAIGQARGDGVLDSLGRKLGEGSSAMRDAVVTALSNYGAAAAPGVERGLAATDEATRRDAAEVAWRLPPSRPVVTVVREALQRHPSGAVLSLLRCALVHQEVGGAIRDVTESDPIRFAEALDYGLARLESHASQTAPWPELHWSSGPALSPAANLGFHFVVDVFDREDARLLPLLSTVARHLELADRDGLARHLFEADADVLAAICVAGPAATLSLDSDVATIEALARMATPAALIRLEGIAFDDPDPGLRRRAFRRLYQAAKARNLKTADIFERAVVELPPEATIDQSICAIVEAQAIRVLHETMVSGHRWPMERWRQTWADSPLFQDLVGRLVWAIYDYGLLKKTFRMDESGELVDVHDEPVKLEPFTEVGLPVPAAFDRVERQAWNTILADYEIVAPFPQMERDLEPRSVEDLVLDGAGLRSILSHGWYPSTPGLERHYGFLRPFPRLGITASLEISPGVGDEDDELQTIDTLAFVDGIHSEFPSISRVLEGVPVEAQIQVAMELWQATSAITRSSRRS